MNVMTDHISWTTYIISVLAAAAIYYSWVGLRFYRNELARFLRIDRKPQDDGQPLAITTSVMGAVAQGPESLVGDEELRFGEPDTDDTLNNVAPTAGKLGTPDLLEEVEALISVIAETEEPKENFLVIYRLLIEKYMAIADEDSRSAVEQRLLDPKNGFIFDLKAAELQELWLETTNQK